MDLAQSWHARIPLIESDFRNYPADCSSDSHSLALHAVGRGLVRLGSMPRRVTSDDNTSDVVVAT